MEDEKDDEEEDEDDSDEDADGDGQVAGGLVPRRLRGRGTGGGDDLRSSLYSLFIS